jgi:hypothetical protein
MIVASAPFSRELDADASAPEHQVLDQRPVEVRHR